MITTISNICAPRRLMGLPLALCLALLFALSACSSDDVGAVDTSCSTDFDCPMGTVCGAGDLCIEASCEFCTTGQICYKTDANPEGTCSAPECAISDDCDDGQPCNGGVCGGTVDAPECGITNPCPEGQICNWEQKCVADGPGEGCTGQGDCIEGEFCDPTTKACLPAVSCDNVECDPGETCIEPYGTCQPENSTCEGISAADCSGATPHFDQQNCACVACTSSGHCGAGQACVGGTCQTNEGCNTPCSADQPGTCGGSTPYCIDNCCIECLGAADCTVQGHICIEGFCGPAPSCDQDPNACPTGYECVSGECRQPGGGQSCDPSNPMSCDNPIMMCDPATGTCTGLGGDMGCGMCDPDCTCPNGLTCDTNSLIPMCTGCQSEGFFDFSGGCPGGGLCLEGVCLSF